MYSFENFKEDLSHGGEANFTYKGLIYAIVRTGGDNPLDGWYYCDPTKSHEEIVFYDNMSSLLDNSVIDGRSLKEVFNSDEIEDITIW